MIIDCAHYQDGHRTDEGVMPLEEAVAQAAQDGFVWLELFEPTEEELARVRDTFGLHPLAVEDALNVFQRPKIDDYDGDVRLVLLRTARYDHEVEEVEFGNIVIFVAPAFVITVRQGSPSMPHEARQRLEQQPELLAAGSSSALWTILDEVVDNYAPVVAAFENDCDEFEGAVFSGVDAATARIYSLRREATDFSRAVHPLLGVVEAIERTAAPELRPYLRLVHDHLRLVDDEAAALNDLLSTVLEVSMAVSSLRQTSLGVRQNTTIQQLTILATIFLPLTFISGVFGQVFAWHIRDVPTYTALIVYGLAVLALPLVLLTWLARARMTHAGRG